MNALSMCKSSAVSYYLHSTAIFNQKQIPSGVSLEEAIVRSNSTLTGGSLNIIIEELLCSRRPQGRSTIGKQIW